MGLWRRFRDDERGSSLVILGVSLLAIFGAATLTLDAGNLWQSRRNIITATDATAHQEARAAALDGPDFACGEGEAAPWLLLLQDNAGMDVTPVACELVEVSDGAGYVAVEAEQPVDFRFAPIFGIGDSDAFSMSAAQYGFMDTIREGLRPMAFCLENGDIQEWINGGGTGDPDHDAGVYHLTWTKDAPAACGDSDAPGNWGWTDLNGHENSNDDEKAWVKDGYSEDNAGGGSGQVEIGGCDTAQETDSCEAAPGQRSGRPDECGESTIGGALSCLVQTGEVFWIPIYDVVDCDGGGGANCNYHVVQFLGVRLVDFCLTANGRCNGQGGHVDPDTGEQEDYFDFEFVDSVASGSCCLSSPPSDIDTGVRTIRLCGTDHDPLAADALDARCSFDE